MEVVVTKTVTEEYVLEALSKDEAEYEAIQRSENGTNPDGSEVEDVTVEGSELDRCTYLQDEIDFLEEEVLNVHSEDKYEELVEDNISKKDLADIIQVTLERLMIEIKAEDSDKLVRLLVCIYINL